MSWKNIFFFGVRGWIGGKVKCQLDCEEIFMQFKSGLFFFKGNLLSFLFF